VSNIHDSPCPLYKVSVQRHSSSNLKFCYFRCCNLYSNTTGSLDDHNLAKSDLQSSLFHIRMDFPDPEVFAALPHDNRGSVVIGTVCFVLLVASLATGLRLYTRLAIVQQMGADDYIVAIALVCFQTYLLSWPSSLT
jgi:hypothetical protein